MSIKKLTEVKFKKIRGYIVEKNMVNTVLMLHQIYYLKTEEEQLDLLENMVIDIVKVTLNQAV